MRKFQITKIAHRETGFPKVTPCQIATMKKNSVQSEGRQEK